MQAFNSMAKQMKSDEPSKAQAYGRWFVHGQQSGNGTSQIVRRGLRHSRQIRPEGAVHTASLPA